MKLNLELTKSTLILCQADASMASLLAEKEADEASESFKAPTKKNKKKNKKRVQPVRT